MSERTEYTDKSSLIAWTGVLNTKQITETLESYREICIQYLKDVINVYNPKHVGLETLTSEIREQIERFTRYLDNIREAVIEVSVVRDSNGKLFGYSYLWVGCEELYNSLMGLDFNGLRLEFEAFEDPNWMPPPDMDWDYHDVEVHEAKLQPLIQAALEEIRAKASGNWADIEEADQEEAAAEARIRATYAPRIYNFPMVPHCAYETLTEAQHEAAMEMLKEWSTPKRDHYVNPDSEAEVAAFAARLRSDPKTAKYATGIREWILKQRKDIDMLRLAILGEEKTEMPKEWDPKWGHNPPPQVPTIVPRYGTIVCAAATVHDVEPGESKTTLVCLDAPHWITEEMILERFKQFNTDPRLITVNGVQKSYPLVEIRQGDPRKRDPWQRPLKSIKVIFSNDSQHLRDSLFAYKLRRRVVYPLPKGLGNGMGFNKYTRRNDIVVRDGDLTFWRLKI